ncbi:MAG: hypothetical protein ACPGSB_08355 [Opitutales bacterium]
MSKFSKVLYLFAILLLGWLAAMPYWPTIKEEAKNIYATWLAIRESDNQEYATEDTVESDSNLTRQRAVAQPKPLDELLITAEEADTEGLDPFLAEARERALDDPEAAMQWLQEQSTGSERLRGMLEVVALWAAKDSESALLWLESNAQGLARLETLNSGVELWAQRDPKAAANWIDGMANDGSKIAAAKSLASNWAKTDPATASAWVDTLPKGPLRQEAASALAISWMETDPAGATAWATQEALRTVNNQALLETIKIYAQTSPDEAEAFIRQLGPVDPFATNDIGRNYVEQFIHARAESDPAGTAKWLQSLPPGDPLYQTKHAQNILSIWTKTDSIAASAWLSEQPLGAERDAAIVGFAETIQKFEPEAAATWANTISNPEQRVEQLTNSIRTWANSEPQAALEWVIHSELEPALQEQLARKMAWSELSP